MTDKSSMNGTEKIFEWDQATKGFILGSFFYGYIFTQFIGGFAATRFGGNIVCK
jgi:ACS family sodium-dependent inorganic phosphate cotransporter